MPTTKISGELEIDHERGVIYFHTNSAHMAKKIGTVTVLRICQLPTPIPRAKALDITHLHGTDWEGKPGFLKSVNHEAAPFLAAFAEYEREKENPAPDYGLIAQRWLEAKMLWAKLTGRAMVTCPNCKGQGEVKTSVPNAFSKAPRARPCLKCSGAGKIPVV